MDHLPVSQNRPVNGLETIPLISEKSYDKGPFLTYPIREGKPQVLNVPGAMPFWQYQRLHPMPNKELKAFCQTWLFFGLIHEFLGDIYDERFIQLDQSGGSSTISTPQLLPLLKQWVRIIEDQSSTVTYEHVAKCLHLVYSTLKAAEAQFDFRVKLSIGSIGELFEYAANKAFGIEDNVQQNMCPASWSSLLGNSIWDGGLRGSGWCPSQIEIVTRSSISLQSLYFFTSMQDPVSVARHEGCDNQKCVAHQTDLKNYATQHVTSERQCEEFCIDMPRLNAVVTNGGLPLLRIHDAGPLSNLKVELVDSQPGGHYLALSHVWADGLGNAKANSLPRCQLRRLNRLTQDLRAELDLEDAQTELFFWCDTLCCPVTPGDAKNQVLKQMKDIYENATCVLVLDASLQQYDSTCMSPEETAARILTSGWMRRLWTFQEGALPADKGRLWFQFRDQAINLQPIWQQILLIFNTDFRRRGLAHTIISRLRTLVDFFHRNHNDPGPDIFTLESALQHRSVSVPSDEPLLIGTILGLDVANILGGPGSDETRIHRMWSWMPTAAHGLPKAIIFRLGPRLKEKGFRWAPSSLLYQERTNAVLQTMQEGDNQGISTQHGLLARFSGYHIRFSSYPTWLPLDPLGIALDENKFYMRDDEARWYSVGRRWPTPDGDYLYEGKFNADMRSQTDLWIMHLETEFQLCSDSDQQTRTALLTHHTHKSCDVRYVQSYMHIHINLLRKPFCDMFEAAYKCAQELAESAPARQLIKMSQDGIDKESPGCRAVSDTIRPELDRVAANDAYNDARAIARRSSGRSDDVLFGAIVGMMFLGYYARMGNKLTNQQFCVD